MGDAGSSFLPIRAGENLDVFADDRTLWATIPSVGARAAVPSSLPKDLIAIASWARVWLVTFNTGKTEALILSKHHDMTEYRKSPNNKKTGKYLALWLRGFRIGGGLRKK